MNVAYLDGDIEYNHPLGHEEIKIKRTALYNEITVIANQTVSLPPALPLLACTLVSTERVWKLRNVGLISVVGPTRKLSEEENDRMNVDERRKSINAIRSFARRNFSLGRRTLAGNSNEWRYIPVHRLFNYVESIKKPHHAVLSQTPP